MNTRLPPNLYKRQYRTRGGYKRTLFCPRFKCWDGKRRTFKGIANFTDAVAELERLKALDRQRYDFDHLAPTPKTGGLHVWIDKFLAIKAGKKSAYRDGVSARWLKDFFGDCALSEIVNSRMLEYRNQRFVSETTKNRELAFLRGVLYLAHRDGTLEKMPVIPFEDEHNERVRIASDKEYRAILKAVARDDVRDVIELLRETGFRLGEVLRITAGNLDTAERTVDMRGIREKSGLERALPMSPRAWRVFAKHALGKTGKQRLFTMSRWSIYHHWKLACRDLNITGLWAHDLRATFVTEKERQGWSRKLIREFSGHRSEIIFNRYSRPTLDDLRAFIGDSRYEGQRGGNTRGKRPGLKLVSSGKIKEG